MPKYQTRDITFQTPVSVKGSQNMCQHTIHTPHSTKLGADVQHPMTLRGMQTPNYVLTDPKLALVLSQRARMQENGQ